MKSLAVLILLLTSLDLAHATDRYVTPNGSPSGDCTIGAPCTIQRAADIVNPGDVVLVADGTYTTTPSAYLLTIRRGGTPTAKVTFKSINRWGAKFWGRADTSLNCIRVQAPYVRIEGFDIYEFSYIAVDNVGGSFFELVGNHIHHIARHFCSDGHNGRGGYYSQGFNDILIDRNIFNDIGRLHVGENGCTTSVSRHDHGVYMSGSRVTIRNNVFFNFRSGWPLHFYPSASSDVKIYGNTFSGWDPYDAGRIGQIVINPAISGMYVKNNIFSQTRGYLFAMGNGSTTGEVSNNLTDVAVSGIFSISQPGCVIAGNILNASPRFANVSIADGIVTGTPDFHLLSGSAAIDAGVPLSELGSDFDGNARPRGAGYDIGCHEYAGSGGDLIRPAGISDLGPWP